MKNKRHKGLITLLLCFGTILFTVSSCGFLPEDEEKVTKDGMTLVWSDEFDYTGVPDTTKWKYQTGHGVGGWGNNELQNYLDNITTADTASVANGVLTIKAYYKDGEWKSARMNSKESWKYGYIEARLKITDKTGAWPAFWMMPQNSVYGDWPKSGEIDIMENAPAIGNHRVFSSLHAEGHGGENPVSIGSKTYSESLSSEWHVIGLKWDAQTISAIYDGETMGSYQNDGTTKNWPYNQDFYIILNLAIGGTLGGNASALQGTGAEFQIDYVRVYQ
ncbi:MAG: glycoside hydrolase family 16 protein [Treponema sp.]|nr:glycoside hydrolase family 16 protein [Treponema sp.]